MSETTRLAFEARIVACKPVAGKDPASEYGRGSPGRIEVTFSVEQPPQPKAPHIPYRWADLTGKWKPRPEKAEDQAEYDVARKAYDAEVEKYQRDAAAHRERLIAYAQLVGLAVVFSNQVVSVVVTPANQEFLPGFGAALLPLPEEGARE